MTRTACGRAGVALSAVVHRGVEHGKAGPVVLGSEQLAHAVKETIDNLFFLGLGLRHGNEQNIDVVQKAAVITVYAMFASLLGGEVRKNTKALLTAGVSALINSVLILGAGVSTGLSFLISLIAATIFGAMIYTDKEAGIE